MGNERLLEDVGALKEIQCVCVCVSVHLAYF
jgi:hypothetical protein